MGADRSVGLWAAVVVNYRSGVLLVEAVEALLADDSAGVVDVVVVDNGSDDGSIDALRAARPEVTVIRPGANLGYARAANLGIAATRAPIVAVFNPDTRLRAGSAAHVLDVFAAYERVAIVGPKITNPDGSIYPSARRAPGGAAAIGHAILGGIRPHNRYTAAYRQTDQDPTVPRDVDWVSGAALWFRREALDRVGGWDERYFLFLEDVDVAAAVRAAGWTVRYEPGAEVVHVVGTSRAEAPTDSIVAHHRSAYQYADKWWTGPRRAALPLVAGFLAVRAGLIVGVSTVGRRGRTRASGPSRNSGADRVA